MKIILVITDSRGKNFAFVTDTLKKISLQKLLIYIEKGRVDFVHRVRSKLGEHVRSNPNTAIEDNLDSISVPFNMLIKAKNDLNLIIGNPKFRIYLDLYSAYLKKIQRTEEIITVDGNLWTPKKMVVEKVTKYKKIIIEAAGHFDVDPNALGAIIIDEYARFSGLDLIEDPLALIGRNSTAGLAQVRIETARSLIRLGYYNPNPNDPKLSKQTVEKTPRSHIYKYVAQPKHNIYFAAASIRERIDFWSPRIDISERPDMIQFVYARGSANLEQLKKMDNRAKQTLDEFYPIAEKILGRR